MNEKIVPSWYSDAKYKQASSIWFLKVSLFACFFFFATVSFAFILKAVDSLSHQMQIHITRKYCLKF